MRPDLPDVEQSRLLAEWLAGPRGRLLRRARVGLRRRVLEIGCGHGVVTEELARRCPGEVVAIDREFGDTIPIRNGTNWVMSPNSLRARVVQADAEALPFRDFSFDLVFWQNVLMWVGSPEAAVGEAARVLQGGGCLVAIEPDFGGMIEHPPEVALKDVWLSALRAAGADPEVGRKLPGLCERVGLDVWVELQGIPQPVSEATTSLLQGLPLTDEDEARLREVEARIASRSGTWDVFVHVPYFLIVGTK